MYSINLFFLFNIFNVEVKHDFDIITRVIQKKSRLKMLSKGYLFSKITSKMKHSTHNAEVDMR